MHSPIVSMTWPLPQTQNPYPPIAPRQSGHVLLLIPLISGLLGRGLSGRLEFGLWIHLGSNGEKTQISK